MITSTQEPRAQRVWCDKDNLWVALVDGRQLSVPLAYFPRLLDASDKQRRAVTMSGGGRGLHWEQVDEDISVPALLVGVPESVVIAEKNAPKKNVVSHRASRPPRKSARKSIARTSVKTNVR
jgi:hypothetical protein